MRRIDEADGLALWAAVRVMLDSEDVYIEDQRGKISDDFVLPEDKTEESLKQVKIPLIFEAGIPQREFPLTMLVAAGPVYPGAPFLCINYHYGPYELTVLRYNGKSFDELVEYGLDPKKIIDDPKRDYTWAGSSRSSLLR